MTAQPDFGRNSTGISDAEALRIRLAEDNQALLRRQADLLDAEARLPAIADDDSAGKVADFIKQTTACDKALDAARVGAKEPFLEGGRTVDGWFKKMMDPLAALKARTERALSIYLREKADAERRAREEEARAARVEAQRREAEAMALAEQAKVTVAEADAALDTAVQAQSAAHKAEKAADAKPAELARTRGDFGALATLRREWTFKDLDRDALDLEALRQHLPLDGLEKGIRAFIKSGGRELRGVTIFEDQTASVR